MPSNTSCMRGSFSVPPAFGCGFFFSFPAEMAATAIHSATARALRRIGDLLWSCDPLGSTPSFAVNRRLRILCRSGEPLDLDAVQPGEHRAAPDASAGNIPVAAGPLIDERR